MRAGRRRGAVILNSRGRQLGSEVDLTEVYRAIGASLVALHRGRLHAGLLDGVGADTIRTAAQVTSFEQDSRSVQVALANGERVDAELLAGADGLHRASAPNWSEPVHPSIRDIRAGAGSRRATASRSPLERARAGDEASDSESYRSVSGRSTGSPWRMRHPTDKIVTCAANCWRASIVARAGGRHHRSDTARSHPAHRYLRSRSDRALARRTSGIAG